MNDISRFGTQIKGVIGLVAIALVVGGLVGVYQKAFTSVTRITIAADRTGLQLDKGASVRAFGVPIGEVRGTKATADGVDIDVALDNDKTSMIPADVTASIRATTLFGAKFIQLDVPRGDVARAIRGGQTVQATRTTIEANDVFAHAMTILDKVDPIKVNTTLSAMDTALRGRGEKLGTLITETNTFLTGFNPSLDQVKTDLDLTATVARNYDALAPEALDTIDQLTTTSNLLRKTQQPFDELLTQIVPAANSVGSLIDSIRAPLTAATTSLSGTASLLNEYAPELPCVLDLLVDHTKRISLVIAQKQPNVAASIGFLPGMDPYRYEKNLPQFVTGVGPKCYRRNTAEKEGFTRIKFNDGTGDVYDNSAEIVDVNTDPIKLYGDFAKSLIGENGGNTLIEMLTDPAGKGTTP